MVVHETIHTTCGGQSWLYGKGYEWTITSNSSISDFVFYLKNDGNVEDSNPVIGYASRPVLYLKTSVYKLNGDGSLSSPYMIGM